ncbi:MAG: hypothetical protein HY248_05695, partial [Fimbriimonas ginsengisoli]|nr:hypothetical protein [Fimbriimonas ginsengisoli]
IRAAAWDVSEYIAEPNTSIAADGRHLSFLQRDSRTDNFTFRATSSGVPVAASEFNGAVFDDLNANGVLEPSDLPLGGATVRCTLILPDGSETSLEATSDLSGNYFLTTEGLAGGLPSGTAFRVTQVPLGGAWTQTAPAPDGFGDRYYSGILGSGLGFFYGLDFGNTS